MPGAAEHAEGADRHPQAGHIQSENVVLAVPQAAGTNFERDSHEEERLQRRERPAQQAAGARRRRRALAENGGDGVQPLEALVASGF